MKQVKLLFLIWALAAASVCPGQVLFTNYDYGTNISWHATHTNWLAQGFAVKNNNIEVGAISIDLKRNHGEGQVTLGIYSATDDGQPGEELAKFRPFSDIEDSKERVLFFADKPVELRRRETYFLVLQIYSVDVHESFSVETSRKNDEADGYRERGELKTKGNMLNTQYEDNRLSLKELHVTVSPDDQWKTVSRQHIFTFELLGPEPPEKQ